MIPEIALSVFASQGSLAADVLGIIEAYARVGAAADSGPEATAYFEARVSAAAGLVDEPDECSFDPEAEAIVANLIETTGFDIELPGGLDDGLGPTVNLCAVWSNVVRGFNAEELELLDLVVAGSTIDASFLGRSECREPAEGLDGDPVWDAGPGVDAFQNLYTTVVQTGSRLELDEAFYDDSSEAQYGLRVRDWAIAHYTAIAETARSDLGSVQDPVARVALVSIAVVAADEAWIQAGSLELGGTVGVFFDLLEACIDPDTGDPVGSCDPELQPYLERVFFGGFSVWSLAFTGYTDSIEWRVDRESHTGENRSSLRELHLGQLCHQPSLADSEFATAGFEAVHADSVEQLLSGQCPLFGALEISVADDPDSDAE